MSRGRIAWLSVLIGTLLIGVVVRYLSRMPQGPDLKPRPDALEYGLTAARLAAGGDFALHIDDVDYPSRYPFGFPLLAAPIVRASGGAPEATWRAAFFYGVVAIAGTAVVAHLAAGATAGLVAGLVIALSPDAIDLSVLAMSESLSMALWCGALLLVALAIRRKRSRYPSLLYLASGVAIGLALTVRYTNLAILPPLLLVVGTRHRFTSRRPIVSSLALLFPVAIAGLILLAYQQQTFGDPFGNGYKFWVPKLYGTPFAFSALYAFRPGPAAPWSEGHFAHYGNVLLGGDPRYWTPWVAMLALIGLVSVIRRGKGCPVARLIALATTITTTLVLLFYLTYYWQERRFLIPLLPLFAILAGAGAATIDTWLRSRWPRAGRLVGVAAAIGIALHLAQPLFTTIPARRRAPPSLVSRLAQFDDEIPRDVRLIVNFPISLAQPRLGRDREVIVADRRLCDPHLNGIAEYGLISPIDRRTPSTSALAAGPVVEATTLSAVTQAIQGGRAVYFLQANGEGPDGIGVDALRQAFEFRELRYLAPMTLFQVVPRDTR